MSLEDQIGVEAAFRLGEAHASEFGARYHQGFDVPRPAIRARTWSRRGKSAGRVSKNGAFLSRQSDDRRYLGESRLFNLLLKTEKMKVAFFTKHAQDRSSTLFKTLCASDFGRSETFPL
jgi:hypothetical protein